MLTKSVLRPLRDQSPDRGLQFYCGKCLGTRVSIADEGLAPSLGARGVVFLAAGWQGEESPTHTLTPIPFLPRHLTSSWFHFFLQRLTLKLADLSNSEVHLNLPIPIFQYYLISHANTITTVIMTFTIYGIFYKVTGIILS